MNAEYNQAELFDRYLERRLTLKEMKEFDERLKIDPDFAESFRLHKEIDFALLEQEILFFRQELDKIHQESSIDEIWMAPMMVSPKEDKTMDQAILEEDILSLRSQLEQIHSEIDFEVALEEIPSYSEVERAVAEQDSVLLHDELDRYNAVSYGDHPEMNEKLVLEGEIDTAIQETDVIQLRSQIRKLADELSPATKKLIPLQTRVNRVVAAAAMIVILVSSGLFVGNRVSSDAWIARNLDKKIDGIESPSIPRGADENSDEKVRTANERFLEGDFKNALTIYQFVENEGNGRPYTWVYQGIANYELKNYELAKAYLNKVLADDDNSLIEMAEWYKVKCLVREDKTDEAKALLNKILSVEQHDYKVDAEALNRRLK